MLMWERANDTPSNANLPFPKWKISDSSKQEEFKAVNFEFDENGRKFTQE